MDTKLIDLLYQSYDGNLSKSEKGMLEEELKMNKELIELNHKIQKTRSS